MNYIVKNGMTTIEEISDGAVSRLAKLADEVAPVIVMHEENHGTPDLHFLPRNWIVV